MHTLLEQKAARRSPNKPGGAGSQSSQPQLLRARRAANGFHIPSHTLLPPIPVRLSVHIRFPVADGLASASHFSHLIAGNDPSAQIISSNIIISISGIIIIITMKIRLSKTKISNNTSREPEGAAYGPDSLGIVRPFLLTAAATRYEASLPARLPSRATIRPGAQ